MISFTNREILLSKTFFAVTNEPYITLHIQCLSLIIYKQSLKNTLFENLLDFYIELSCQPSTG